MSNGDPIPVAQLPHKKSTEFRTIYSNNVGLGATFYDVMVVFGSVVPGYAGATDPFVEDTLAVHMSWEHAKAMVLAMSGAIEAYEKEHGQIRPSPK